MALFLPADSRIDRLVRALMGITFFSAAYTAENVRGGLQAVPSGQIEAAKAVGTAIAKQAVDVGIKAVCFDRNSYKYHGRVKALADAAREAGLAF